MELRLNTEGCGESTAGERRSKKEEADRTFDIDMATHDEDDDDNVV